MVFRQYVRICDEGEKAWKEYVDKIHSMSLEELVKEFFTYLDLEEESDSGRVFNPIIISNCRVMMQKPLGQVLQQLRKKVE